MNQAVEKFVNINTEDVSSGQIRYYQETRENHTNIFNDLSKLTTETIIMVTISEVEVMVNIGGIIEI